MTSLEGERTSITLDCRAMEITQCPSWPVLEWTPYMENLKWNEICRWGSNTRSGLLFLPPQSWTVLVHRSVISTEWEKETPPGKECLAMAMSTHVSKWPLCDNLYLPSPNTHTHDDQCDGLLLLLVAITWVYHTGPRDPLGPLVHWASIMLLLLLYVDFS